MAPEPSDLTLPEGERRDLIRWAAECVRRLLPIFESAAPGDLRLSQALDGAEAFARGELSVGPMRHLAFGCHAAARDVDDAAASAVARACGQAASIAHMGGHSREISRYTAKALGGDAAPELAWQREHIPARFEAYVYGDTNHVSLTRSLG